MHSLYTLEVNNGIIDTKYSNNFGHRFGDGFESTSKRYRYINIAKNASSTISYLLRNNGWDGVHGNFHSEAHDVYLVAMRDPSSRWISGMTEFLVGNFSSFGGINNKLPSIDNDIELLSNDFISNIITDQIIFDGHTLPQSWFLNGLPIDKTMFFYISDGFFNKFCNFVGVHNQTNIGIHNQSLDNNLKKRVSSILTEMMENNKSLRREIDKHYYCDHQLIDKVNFV